MYFKKNVSQLLKQFDPQLTVKLDFGNQNFLEGIDN